eukprot:Gb_00930 [translate_table: standard]
MGIAQPFWNQKKTVLLPESIRHLQGAIGLVPFGTETKTCALRSVEAHCNANGVEMRGDVRRLCKQDRLKEALHMLHLMDCHGIRIELNTYISLLQVCDKKKALFEGKLVHAHIIQSRFEPNIFLGNTLLIMYTKFGNLVDARRVLDEMPDRNVVSWTVLIGVYARHGFGEEALKLYYQMQRTGIQPNEFTFASVLPACASLASLEHGKEVHDEIIRTGYQSNVFVGSALIDMYVKCGNIKDARNVFDKMPDRNVVSWNAIIGGYAQNGYFDEAMKLFEKMPERSLISWNAIVAGYAHNGYVEEALKLFEEMPERDVVSWSAMISGYAQSGHGVEALKLFHQMQRTDIKPNEFTFAGVLQACANLAALEHGKEVHREIVRYGFQSDVFVGSALVYMYGKCGSVENARQVFDKMPERNTVSWNAIIVGYAQNGHVDEALNLFQKIPEQNVVLWNSVIAGNAQNGHFDNALNLFREMQLKVVKPNPDTYAGVLPACANLAVLEHGKEIHEDIIRNGFQSDVFVASALVDMYSKCGSIEDARIVFDLMPRRDMVSWTAMIVAYAMHGCCKEALQLFAQMQESRTNPSHVTFIGVLSACCHSGLVDDGWHYYNSMLQDYHITPVMEHYCCMVDLLGRAGRLDEAEDFINKMPIKPDGAVWGSLLGACRIHSNIKLGERVAECLFELDPKRAAPYVLLSNIYAAAERWDDIAKVRNLMKERGVKKAPGCSWIEVNKQVHTFLVGDRAHPQTEKIYAKLESLSGQMKEAGYVPDTNFALNDVEEEQKKHILCHHSEKLAIAYGLLNTTPGKPIRIIKNLRVCGDCHLSIKFISKIVLREIVVRDANRFHHFKVGQCSCGDYW